MAKLPKNKKLIQEDFPSQRSWIAKLLQPLNQFMETVALALDKGLTVGENLDAQIAQVVVTGGEEVSFSIRTRSRPQGLLVTRVEIIGGNEVALTEAVWPTWEVDPVNNTVKISSWIGLDSGTRYRITLFVHTV